MANTLLENRATVMPLKSSLKTTLKTRKRANTTNIQKKNILLHQITIHRPSIIGKSILLGDYNMPAAVILKMGMG